MKAKGKLGILVLACAVVVSALFWYTQKEPYSTEATVDSLWDKYSVQSTQFDGDKGDANSILSVTVYDEDDITEVESYLESNLSEEDLEHYKLNVYQYSSDVEEFRDNAQKNLDSNDLNPDN